MQAQTKFKQVCPHCYGTGKVTHHFGLPHINWPKTADIKAWWQARIEQSSTLTQHLRSRAALQAFVIMLFLALCFLVGMWVPVITYQWSLLAS